ncbi:MAG TPA: hypothetical protein VFA61_00100 [Candidatus Udaeobacter sp.]|nr:hypothetical protein [Candidatus Udaeobacter sp.]
MPPLVLPRHVWQSRSMTGKLSKCYPSDITAALQLCNVFGNRVIETELAVFYTLCKQCRGKQLADRAEIEYRIDRNSTILYIVSHAVVKKRRLTIYPDCYCNASSTTLWQYRLKLLRNDLFDVDLSPRRCSS